MNFLKRSFIVLFISLVLFFIILSVFKPILTSNTLIFPYSVKKFDIIQDYPNTWNYIKQIYIITLLISIFLITNSTLKFILLNFHFNKIKSKDKKNCTYFNNNSLKLLVGKNSNTNDDIYIPEKGLYQNILITGTIGSR